mgnify:CR=1 FL=1
MDNLNSVDMKTSLSTKTGYVDSANFNAMMMLENGTFEKDVAKYIVDAIEGQV